MQAIFTTFAEASQLQAQFLERMEAMEADLYRLRALAEMIN